MLVKGKVREGKVHFIKLLLGKSFVAVFKIIWNSINFSICSHINHFTVIEIGKLILENYTKGVLDHSNWTMIIVQFILVFQK